jgi:hypothetical protein
MGVTISKELTITTCTLVGLQDGAVVGVKCQMKIFNVCIDW